MNPAIISKLRNLERRLNDERGTFRLFALLHRDGSPNTWDLVVSAPWLDDLKMRGVAFIAKEVHNALSSDEMTSVSRISVVGTNDPPVKALNKFIRVEGNVTEVFNSNIGGVQIDHGYIVTSTGEGKKL